MTDNDTTWTLSDLAIICVSNRPDILEQNLNASPMVASGQVPVHVEANPPSASIGYNRGLEATDAPILIFAHQDVYFPPGWEALLLRQIAEITRRDPNWALIGSYGIGEDGAGYGPVWSSSIGHVIGRVAMEPVPVQSFDELLIIMRRDAGLRFDEALPGFHLYGTDIVQMARTNGQGAYVAALPVVHNDRVHGELGQDFVDCFRFIKRKWPTRLPLRTPITKITWHELQLHKERWNLVISQKIWNWQVMARPIEDPPDRYAMACGWNDLRPPAP